MLTAWLLLPILVFAGLVAWIFATMSGPKAMTPDGVGQGAGDTGGANALGEWLAGRSPNQVERANIARRQRQAVDPFWWPGGTRVVVDAPGADSVTLGWIDAATGLLRAVVLRQPGDAEGAWAAVLREHRPAEGSLIYLSAHGMAQRIKGGRGDVVDDEGRTLVPTPVAPVSIGDTPTAEPLTLELDAPG